MSDNINVFGDETYFNEAVTFYGPVRGIETDRIFKNNSSVAVGSTETVIVTTNSVGIVTFSEDNIGIANTVILERTGHVQQLFERANISSTSLTGTVNLNVLSGTLYYYTADATGNWTVNVTGNATTTLNSILPINKSVTITILSTQGGSATYADVFKVDNTTITPKWMNGITPSAGYANSINIYTFVIIKTANNTFTVIGSLNRTT
jgi:hypothetical protein